MITVKATLAVDDESYNRIAGRVLELQYVDLAKPSSGAPGPGCSKVRLI